MVSLWQASKKSSIPLFHQRESDDRSSLHARGRLLLLLPTAPTEIRHPPGEVFEIKDIDLEHQEPEEQTPDKVGDEDIGNDKDTSDNQPSKPQKPTVTNPLTKIANPALEPAVLNPSTEITNADAELLLKGPTFGYA